MISFSFSSCAFLVHYPFLTYEDLTESISLTINHFRLILIWSVHFEKMPEFKDMQNANICPSLKDPSICGSSNSPCDFIRAAAPCRLEGASAVD